MTPAFYPVFQAKKELWEKEEQKKAQSSAKLACHQSLFVETVK